MTFYHRLLISEGNKSGGVALTRDHPFSPIPHPPIHQHQSTRITSNYSLGPCFRSCSVDFNPSVISSAVLIRGRAGPNQCSKWIFRGIHSLEGRREGDAMLCWPHWGADRETWWLWRQGTEDSQGQSDLGLHIVRWWMGWELQRERDRNNSRCDVIAVI